MDIDNNQNDISGIVNDGNDAISKVNELSAHQMSKIVEELENNDKNKDKSPKNGVNIDEAAGNGEVIVQRMDEWVDDVEEDIITKCQCCEKTRSHQWTKKQLEVVQYYCPDHANNRNKGVFRFKCPDCGKLLKTLLNFMRHLQYFRDKDKGHNIIDDMHRLFNIAPCKQVGCGEWIRTGFIPEAIAGRNIGNAYNGYCKKCYNINRSMLIGAGSNSLGDFEDIDNIHRFMPSSLDKIPESVICDIADCRANLWRLIKTATVKGDKKKLELVIKLYFLMFKLVLAKPRRGGGNEGNKIKIDKLIRNRIQAIQQKNYDKILYYMVQIEEDMDVINDLVKKGKKKYDSMNEFERKRYDEKRILKQIKRNLSRGSMSRAWRATKDVKNKDLNDENNLGVWRSKFIANDAKYEEKIINYVDGNYPNIEIEEEAITALLSKADPGAGGGVDGVKMYHEMQLWENGGDGYRRAFMGHWDRILNGKLTQYELENNAAALGIALEKDGKPNDLRPILVQIIQTRLPMSYAEIVRAADILEVQCGFQMGLNKKDALNITIQSFQCWEKLKTILN